MQQNKQELLLTIAQGLRSTRTNIAESYADWLQVCFACASFGESGREPAHLISSVSAKYKREDTDNQFNACLRSVKDCDNLAPLLSLAKVQGFILRDFLASQCGRRSAASKPRRSASDGGDEVIYDFPKALPRPLARCLPLADSEPAGFALISSFLVAASSVLDGCSFMYSGRAHHLNLYACCVAPPASGKSINSVVRQMLGDVHDRKRRKSEGLYNDYRALLKSTPAADRDQILPPPLLTHILPADTSVSALLKTISDNGGGGVIWESELDTLTRSFRSEHGNFSDALRNNWAGETISYNRKITRELLEVTDPHFAVHVSCTPAQVAKFFVSAENGLFSRFWFVQLPAVLEWRSQWDAAPALPIVSETARFLADLEEMSKACPCRIVFSEAQMREHDRYFAQLQASYYTLLGAETLAIIRRLAVTWARIASVLTLLELADLSAWGASEVSCPPFACQAAYALIERAASDAAEVLLTLPPEGQAKGSRREGLRAQIWASLPPSFTLSELPESMSQAARYRLVRMWLDEGKITKAGKQYNKVQ